MVRIELFESLSSKFVGDATVAGIFIIISSLVISLFSGEVADFKVSEDSVSELIEFFLINFTWGGGIDFGTGLFGPFPVSISDGVVLGCGEILKSNLDLIV